MKKSVLIISALLSFGLSSSAQDSAENNTAGNNRFISAMKNNLKLLDTATTPSSFTRIANTFERIGNTEKSHWEPFYFAAFCYGVMASNNPDKSAVDALIDKAMGYLTLAEALDKDNSEIHTLYGMIIYTRLSVDPIARWQSFGPEAMQRIEKARMLDPQNPRPYLIDATAKLRIPEGLGGGPRVAKAAIETCLQKFDSFVKRDSIAPNWGKSQAEKLLKSLSN